MSSSSSTGSIKFLPSSTDQSKFLGPNGDGQVKLSNSHGVSDEVSDNFNRLAKSVNSKSKEYKHQNTGDNDIETSSDSVLPNQLETSESNAITNQMNNALDVFFQFEDVADSETREGSEFQTERAIIREMCNVVIKKLDFNQEWDLAS